MFRRFRDRIPFFGQEEEDPIVRAVPIPTMPTPSRQPTRVQSVRLPIPPIPLIVELRKTQLEYHIINFNKIMSFYEYLEKFTLEFISFIQTSYFHKSKKQILKNIPVFYRKPSYNNPNMRHPDFFTLYDKHKEYLFKKKDDINQLIRLKYETGESLPLWLDENRIINAIEQICIETNPNWQQKYNALFDEFDKKKSLITHMFSDLETNLAKNTEAKHFAERLVTELIHTKKYIDALFNTYIKYSHLPQKGNFDFNLFEETLLNIINKDPEIDPPSYESVNVSIEEPKIRPYVAEKTYYAQNVPLTSIIPPNPDEPQPLPTSMEGSSSKLTYNGPPPRFAPSNLHTTGDKTDKPYLGGIRRSRSKRSNYLKTFNVYSKRKSKTVQKRRNYKKTKHNKTLY